MPGTRDIRRRIKSVKSTAQITRAMQMVAASKMSRAQQVALAGRAYAEELNCMLASVRGALVNEEISHPLLEKREERQPCVLLITTDKGLCGGLNTNLFKEAANLPSHAHFISIGRKGRQFLARVHRNLVADFEFKENITHDAIKPVVNFLMSRFLNREADSIHILYPDFINTLVQRPRLIKLLPIADLSQIQATTALDNHQASQTASMDSTHQQQQGLPGQQEQNYLFEPNLFYILDKLLPYYIDFMFYQIMLDARAAEHSARMVAMKNASDNAREIIKELTLEYNKARQASITNEILEISTAQMALN